MGDFKRISLAMWFKQVGGACRRFPVAVLLLAFLSCFLLHLNHGGAGKVDVKWCFFYIFYPATGALLAVSLQLLTEEFKNRIAAIVTQAVVHATWLGVSLYLAQFDHFSVPQLVAVSATVVTMALSIFLTCFYHKNDDVPFWNFSQRVFVALMAGFVVGVVLTLGLILFVQSLDWLFGLTFKDSVFADVPSVCMVFLAPLLAMSQFPRGKEKWDRSMAGYSGFVKGVAQYLFIPLLLLYLVTLYVYAAKILFSWQLPVGWVCYLVSASMLGMLILLFVTYPVQHEQASSFFKSVMRWLPMALLPLLALMSVAIGRRLSDYGITMSRLYVLVFNIWCYVVCIGLLLGRNKRIWWVPASFAVVLFLISVGPQSIPNMTQRHLIAQARKAFVSSGIQRLPMTGEQYDAWLASVDGKIAASIDAKIHYLQTYYDVNVTCGLLGKDAVVGVASNSDNDSGGVTKPSINYSNYDLIKDVVLPKSYTRLTVVEGDLDDLVSRHGSNVMLAMRGGASSAEHLFEFDIRQFAGCDKERNHGTDVEPLVINNDDKTLVVESFSVQLEGDSIVHIAVSGLLFSN